MRGRDIKRYRVDWNNTWVIDTHNGYGNTPAININNYPAIKDHLDKFCSKLKHRQDQGVTPYNLRNCAYHEVFRKEKLFWMSLTEQGHFAYEQTEIYCVNSGYVMSGTSLKFLCAMLNSKLMMWFINKTAGTSGMGVPQWFRVTVETIPIPIISANEQSPFISLVDKVLFLKNTSTKNCTRGIESEIDTLIYSLYKLNAREVAAVESISNPQ